MKPFSLINVLLPWKRLKKSKEICIVASHMIFQQVRRPLIVFISYYICLGCSFFQLYSLLSRDHSFVNLISLLTFFFLLFTADTVEIDV